MFETCWMSGSWSESLLSSSFRPSSCLALVLCHMSVQRCWSQLCVGPSSCCYFLASRSPPWMGGPFMLLASLLLWCTSAAWKPESGSSLNLTYGHRVPLLHSRSVFNGTPLHLSTDRHFYTLFWSWLLLCLSNEDTLCTLHFWSYLQTYCYSGRYEYVIFLLKTRTLSYFVDFWSNLIPNASRKNLFKEYCIWCGCL